MFIHCSQCEVKAHLPNGRYVIEVTIPARKRMAFKTCIGGPVISWITVNEPEYKIKALSASNFYFSRFYTLRKLRKIDDNGKEKTQWFIGPCARMH
jgi:hypothetical protein